MNNHESMAEIEDALNNIRKKTILVVGDFCLDKYVYSDPNQDDVSVESGKAAWQIYSKKIKAGAAGTITNNILSLGAKVICVGFIGNDGEGFELKAALNKAGANTNYLITTDEMVTATYFKPMRLIDGAWREDVRFDFRNNKAPSKALSEQLLKNLKQAAKLADGIVVSDQFYERNSGVISDAIREELCRICKECSVPCLVDSRAFAAEYRDTYVKCNNYELMKYAGGVGNPENRDDVAEGAMRLSKITGSPVFVTRNKDGVIIYDGELHDIPAYPIHGEIDVTGAGDASNAGLIIGLSLGLSPCNAARIATAVSSITIHILGDTGTATIDELKNKLRKGI